jgi:hypothetical protein
VSLGLHVRRFRTLGRGQLTGLFLEVSGGLHQPRRHAGVGCRFCHFEQGGCCFASMKTIPRHAAPDVRTQLPRQLIRWNLIRFHRESANLHIKRPYAGAHQEGRPIYERPPGAFIRNKRKLECPESNIFREPDRAARNVAPNLPRPLTSDDLRRDTAQIPPTGGRNSVAAQVSPAASQNKNPRPGFRGGFSSAVSVSKEHAAGLEMGRPDGALYRTGPEIPPAPKSPAR